MDTHQLTAEIARFANLEISTTGTPGMVAMEIKTQTSVHSRTVPVAKFDRFLDALAQHLPERPSIDPAGPPGRTFGFLMQTGPNPLALFRVYDYHRAKNYLPAPHKDDLREMRREGGYRLGVVEELVKVVEGTLLEAVLVAEATAAPAASMPDESKRSAPRPRPSARSDTSAP